MRTGEAVMYGDATAYSLQSDLILDDEEIANNWQLVEAADQKELQAFVTHKVFGVAAVKQRSQQCYTSGKPYNEVDGTWIRKWKLTHANGKDVWIIKSRLCGRGFLDKQKWDVQRSSSTASRISQRLAVSLAQLEKLDMELWDISNAFLQGLSFKELYDRAAELGLEVKAQRDVLFRPPRNVWRHLKTLDSKTFRVEGEEDYLFVLVLPKPMYGLVDAPFLWGIALSIVLKRDLGATPSLLDKDFYYWTERGHIIAIFTVHVDDVLAVGNPFWTGHGRC
jgi:hypothetical protein